MKLIQIPARPRQEDRSLHSVKPISRVTGLRFRNCACAFDLDEGSDLRLIPRRHPRGDQEWTSPALQSTMRDCRTPSAAFSSKPALRFRPEAVNMAAQKVRSGWDELVIAGGVEPMSRVPMDPTVDRGRSTPATNYDNYFVPQGVGADLIATIEGFA
ncbi:unnamed protein product, partial [Mesorhabditis spiculigera]